MSRRTVTRTAVWAVPVVSTAVGAPALAASRGCQSVLGRLYTDQSGDISSIHFAGSGPGQAVSAGVAITQVRRGRTVRDPLGNGVTGTTGTAQYQPGFYYVVLSHDQGMEVGDVLTMTVTLSRPVANFFLTLTQVDHLGGYYDDEVWLGTPGFSIVTRGTEVLGTGTQAVPFSSGSEASIHSNANDVTVTWPGSLDQFVVNYVVGDAGERLSQCGQWIGVGNVGYDSCG
ncbi:MAG TPA: hypothetical protein VHW64_03810 [Nocardioides sp.]|uniref:hypothetical protein n=1 Tax=Nocardioides sp. TaxID=35761 RepID=UPI002E30F1AC|nr:hypothetical protein [Nocardioides sp.]HEX3929802.1 hypothetical protein [Nocardioides sp.]